MDTLQRLQKLFLLGLVFSLVITSHFTILDMMVHCSDHNVSHNLANHDHHSTADTTQHQDDNSSTSSSSSQCPAHYKCHTSAFQYFFPTTLFVVSSVIQPLENQSSNKLMPPSPVMDGPFQPPRV